MLSFKRIAGLKILASLLFISGLGQIGEASADSGSLVGYVQRVLTTSNSDYGGCMAALTVDPQSIVPGCQSMWVTFSCSGDFTDPLRAYRMLDMAQLAWATQKPVYIQFRDDQKHNGYCFSDRIDVMD
jgi:hypothetical protein